ncbi:lycopene cyclase family protein [Saccharothrix longispora]|uniref:lycopene cyclase family protein n=1 Tax=Saccharothrix longispora TaxID=33920 RepID=UPI00286B0450|nr:lycopene cyclase family protein [Saccharothrix longispora]
MDVVVVGGGPAGRALARACAERGVGTALVDPNPERRFRATYAAWADELPEGAPVAVSVSRSRVVTTEEHAVARGYAVLDNERLWRLPASVDVVAGRVVGRSASSVRLADGRVLSGRVVDASGAVGGSGAAQTAVGVVVPAGAARPFVDADEAVIMDWRKPPVATTADPTFLYAIPVSATHVLLEETSLARRPGLPLAELRLRLHGRLAAHGVAVPEDEERVRIPLDGRPRDWAFGAASGLIHPATGYSVAAALRRAPVVAAALAEGRPVVRPVAERVVHAMWSRGLASLLAMRPDEVPEFFHQFFLLPDDHQRAYLGGHGDLRGTLAAMLHLFRDASWAMRARMAFPVRTAKSAGTPG